MSSPSSSSSSSGKVLLITGCDSGLGHALAVQAAAAGFSVFAGCLTPAGCASVKTACDGGSITPLLLDVTNEASIATAVATLSSRTRGLHALVNNAGLGYGGAVDWMHMAEYRAVMDVNFFGAVAMTKACMGLLTTVDPTDGRRGRVVYVSSIAGLLAAPGMSAYSASKYALEAFSDSLRREMVDFRMPVVLIEPSFLRTPILDGFEARSKAMWAAMSAEVRERWGAPYFDQRTRRAVGVKRQAEDPKLAVDAMLTALSARIPQARYKAGWRATWLYGPLTFLPTGIVDALVARNSRSLKPAAVLLAAAGNPGKGTLAPAPAAAPTPSTGERAARGRRGSNAASAVKGRE